jgi:hypothetical protein
MDRTSFTLIIKSLWFQLLWLLAVLGREPWQLLLAFLIGATLFVDKRMLRGKLFLLLLFLPGLAIDLLFFKTTLFAFSGNQFPLWLALLWVVFTWYLLQIAPLLSGLPVILQAFAGAVVGPASYGAGVLLGAVSWPMGATATVSILAVWWALLLPTLVYVIQKPAMLVKAQ